MPAAERHDCVIVGGGLAGISAARRLIELGIRPTVLERGTEDGGAGNARISGGLLHVAWEAMDTPADDLHARLLKETDGEIDPALARRFADGAGPALEWLESHGIEISPKGDVAYMRHALAPHGEGIGRRIQPERGTDRTLVSLYKGVRDGGGEVRLGVSAEGLAPDSDGGWIVSCRGADGSFDLHARVVLVADGGFQGSPEMLTRYVGASADTALLRAMPTSTGEGLRMLLANGAQTAGLGRVYGHVVSRDAFENDTLWPYPTLDKLCIQALLVDRRGERFPTHATDGVALVNELVRTETPRAFRIVCDEALWNGAGADNPYGAPVPNPDLVERGGDHHAAETLEGLAEAIGIDAPTLQAAVEAHNADPSKLAIAEAPFHSIAIVPGITFTQGGVKVDADCAVLDALDAPIPGLYAAGSCTGGIHGGPRGGYVGGLADALVFGLAAGDAIGAEVG
ncbi:MAG TPA: FAD-dependent oxidoreductase [Solirubrobacterales bacterium]|nr:FAD-dependent oxidoreductase [Solirubrobacterales bacterium]